MNKVFFLLFISGITTCLYSQEIKLLHSGNGISLRGLSVVNDKIIWVSGNKGTVGRSLDSGKTWQWIKIKGFEKRDFRDIEAFDIKTAVIMAIDTPAHILKTIDGGVSWKVVYENKTAGMFLDAMEFWNIQSGIVIGDPINDKFFIARSFDGGDSWMAIPPSHLPAADVGEACFAASGTNVRALNLGEACFVSGGKRCRLFYKSTPLDMPLLQGKETTGANSIAVWNNRKRKNSSYWVITGGDFANDTLRDKNCIITKDAGKTWITPIVAPHGYRSCVEFITKNKLITCGTSGVDISEDGGINWRLISTTGFHVCRKAKKGNIVLLAGSDGKIGMLQPSLK